MHRLYKLHKLRQTSIKSQADVLKLYKKLWEIYKSS